MHTGRPLNRDLIADLIRLFNTGHTSTHIATTLHINRRTIYRYVRKFNLSRPITHGKLTTYQYGCRCDLCRQARADYCRARRLSIKTNNLPT